MPLTCHVLDAKKAGVKGEGCVGVHFVRRRKVILVNGCSYPRHAFCGHDQGKAEYSGWSCEKSPPTLMVSLNGIEKLLSISGQHGIFCFRSM